MAPPEHETVAHAARRVLLAQSDAQARAELADELRSGGWAVVEVEDGGELLDYLTVAPHWRPLPAPDVIVADIEMPGCGGLQAIEALRARGVETPVVFTNAGPHRGARSKASHLKCVCILDDCPQARQLPLSHWADATALPMGNVDGGDSTHDTLLARPRGA